MRKVFHRRAVGGLRFEFRDASFEIRVKPETRISSLESESGPILQNFRKLDVWKRAHELVLTVYRVTQGLPKEELFGVTMQLRRTSTAIPSRIAEGCGREVNPEFVADLRRALVACNETEYLLLLAKDLGFIKLETHDSLNAETVEVRKMIYGLQRKL